MLKPDSKWKLDVAMAQEMSVIAYSDWDEMYDRPTVAAFGGQERSRADTSDFNLGGKCLGWW